MPKNIVFCADGTWNHPNDPAVADPSANPSNVYKLFLKLAGEPDSRTTALADEQEKTLKAEDGKTIQVAKYLHGVGDSRNWLVKVLGGGFGEGLITRIVRGYTFVSRNYQAGDRIYLVGFSRGAYIARALAGLISAKGLLPPDIAKDDTPEAKAKAYRRGSAVWYAWRQEALKDAARRDTEKRNFLDFASRLQEVAQDLPHFVSAPARNEVLIPAPIEAVAVWDTVGAYGIPEFDTHGEAVDAFRFADTTLSGNVKFGRHAVSIDEQRRNFTPTLWTGGDQPPKRIIQVLFCGGHADVGGSNLEAESGLSDCALQWMTRELKALGLQIGPPVIREKRDPCAGAHAEWLKPWWQVIGTALRRFPDAPGLCLSEAVVLRLAAAGVLGGDPEKNPSRYNPQNIPTYLAERLAATGVEIIPLDP